MQKHITHNHGSYDMYADQRYIGSRATYAQAERDLDEYVFDAITHGDTATATELDGAQAEEPRYTRAAGYDMRRSHGNRESSDCWKDADGIPHWFGVGIDPNVQVAT